MASDQSLPDHLPTTTTLREIFTRYVDINAVPRRSFFALLKHFAQDELEREKLEEFLSEEGAVSPPKPLTNFRSTGAGRDVRVLPAASQNHPRGARGVPLGEDPQRVCLRSLPATPPKTVLHREFREGKSWLHFNVCIG